MENPLGSFREDILIVDDDKLILLALEETLKREGYRVLKASNGEEAINILISQPIAVIVCDQRMPGMSGIEVLKKAQGIRPDAVRIVLTGNRDLETVLQAINIGQVSQFISKPWDDLLLRQTIAESIEKYRLVKENQNLHNLIMTQHKELAKNHEILRHELTVGARIHESLLLGKVPQNIPGFKIAATTIPSKDIDGDFFEFYSPASQILDVVVGDVMGKGLPAALVGTAVKTQLMRFAVPFIHAQVFGKQEFWHDDLLTPQEILQHVHTEIAEKLIHLEYFVSLFYGRFNCLKKTFSYIDCGSTKPIHYKSVQKRIVQLKGKNFPLGMVENDTYRLVEISYGEGDLFIFYSDGITEAKSPEHQLFGVERLTDIVQKNADADVDSLLEEIKSSVVAFAKKDFFEDDLTLIVIKIEPVPVTPNLQPWKLKLRSSLEQLKTVRQFVQHCCQKAPGNTELLAIKLQLAINEAFCNIVEHGYENRPGDIILQVEFQEDGLVFQLSDRGVNFNPGDVVEPDMTGEREDGFGWHIIKEVADSVSYIHKESETGWNHLRIFKKYIGEEENMEFVHTTQDNVLIITPEGESLDAKDASAFKEKVIDLISHQEFSNVIFDLHQLHFIDSSGLGSFLSVLRILHTRGGELKLARMNKPIRTMFELVSMHKIFEIFNSTEDAIRSFK